MTVEVLLAVLIIAVPLSVQAGRFSLFGDTEAATVSTTPEVIKTDLPLDAPVLSAALNPEPVSRGGSDILAQDGVLLSTGPVDQAELSAARQNGGEISVYTVRDGDTLSDIAIMFDVTANTILWANDLPSPKSITPGQTLIILPIAGVQHVVKSGDTIAGIAKKYDGNAAEIISFNQLETGAELAVGTTLVVPGGALHNAPVKKVGVSAKKTAGGSSLINPAPGTIKTQGIHGYNAVDLAGSVGTAVRSAAGGEVIVARTSGWNGGYGNYIVIRHSNGVQTLYAHLSAVSVGVGTTVGQGETIGALGTSGRSTGPHLHFEVRGGKNPF